MDSNNKFSSLFLLFILFTSLFSPLVVAAHDAAATVVPACASCSDPHKPNHPKDPPGHKHSSHPKHSGHHKHHGQPTPCPPVSPPITPTPTPVTPTPTPPVPITPTPVPPTPVTPNPPSAQCPVDTLKLGACVDLLGGLVHIGLGDPIANQCCPLLQGLVELEAAVCLCTTIKLKLLNINIYLPLALQLLITCGRIPPPGFTCTI